LLALKTQPSLKKWGINALFICSAVGLIVLINGWLNETLIPIKSLEHGTLEEYMHQAEIRKFNLQGKLERKLTMKSLSHYQGLPYATIIMPHLVMHQADGTHSELCALRGQSYYSKDIKHFDKIILQDTVQLRHASKLEGNWQLSTEQLTLFPSYLIDTNAAVTLTHPQLHLSATGMSGDLNSGKIRFHQQVKTQYQGQL